MYQSIHNVKEIVRGRIVENTNERTGEKYYTMRVVFYYDELSTCKERYSENSLYGDSEVRVVITLFADTKEALKVKYKALI